MQREAALVLSIILFIVFGLIAYFGARVTVWSSIAFASFIALILLNFFYPPGQAATDTATPSLVIYAMIEIIGILLLAVYITQKSLQDTRSDL
jgi:hypothetical protein